MESLASPWSLFRYSVVLPNGTGTGHVGVAIEKRHPLVTGPAIGSGVINREPYGGGGIKQYEGMLLLRVFHGFPLKNSALFGLVNVGSNIINDFWTHQPYVLSNISL